MKRLLILILGFTLVASSCNKQSTAIITAPKPQVSGTVETPISDSTSQETKIEVPKNNFSIPLKLSGSLQIADLTVPKTEEEQDNEIDQNTIKNIAQDSRITQNTSDIADLKTKTDNLQNQINNPPVPTPIPPPPTPDPIPTPDPTPQPNPIPQNIYVEPHVSLMSSNCTNGCFNEEFMASNFTYSEFAGQTLGFHFSLTPSKTVKAIKILDGLSDDNNVHQILASSGPVSEGVTQVFSFSDPVQSYYPDMGATRYFRIILDTSELSNLPTRLELTLSNVSVSGNFTNPIIVGDSHNPSITSWEIHRYYDIKN